jgi:drug/metabolite transporter (DMT)-like permease
VTRIFTTLALFSVALLCANIVLGLMIGDYNGAFNNVSENASPILQQLDELQKQSPRRHDEIGKLNKQLAIEIAKLTPIETRAIVHILLGVAAALVAVLVNSICVTYFVGTSRWIREVVETYDFPRAWIDEANRVKRSTFPWAVGGMLTAVGIIALGAAAHPGTIRAGTASWVTPHMIGAMLGTAFIAYAFIVQHQRIYANYAIIQRIVAKVKEVRQAKGLDVDEEIAAMAK